MIWRAGQEATEEGTGDDRGRRKNRDGETTTASRKNRVGVTSFTSGLTEYVRERSNRGE